MIQSPLPPRTSYWAVPGDRQRTVSDIFDRSATYYDRSCDIMSFGSGQRYRREALERASLQPGMRVLDVGTGTGLLAREAGEIVGPSGCVIGVDPSLNMMKARRHPGATSLVQSVGESLPFADGVFDFLLMGYALRHVPDLDETFAEYRRVLKPGGRVLLLEITRPASRAGQMLVRIYFGSVVPALARLGTRSATASELMRFYWETIAKCVAPEVILAALARAGFKAERHVVFGIFSEYKALSVSPTPHEPTQSVRLKVGLA